MGDAAGGKGEDVGDEKILSLKWKQYMSTRHGESNLTAQENSG